MDYNTHTTSFVDVTLVHHLLGLEDILVMHAVDALAYACNHACRWMPPHPTRLLTVAASYSHHSDRACDPLLQSPVRCKWNTCSTLTWHHLACNKL